MSREKQIEEMANELALLMLRDRNLTSVCTKLYNAGYRKQSEVIDDFVKKLIDAFPEANPNHRSPCLYYDEYRYIIEELAEEMKGGAE